MMLIIIAVLAAIYLTATLTFAYGFKNCCPLSRHDHVPAARRWLPVALQMGKCSMKPEPERLRPP
jgi:hypothetical protein